jgi:hypothetical protein
MDPPLPPQDPPARPCSSSIIARASAPLASAWPWPRWVLVMRSEGRRFAHTPTATASCPMEGCTTPGASPDFIAATASRSKARMRAI